MKLLFISIIVPMLSFFMMEDSTSFSYKNPVITRCVITSSNLCDTSYAISGDLITCEVWTAENESLPPLPHVFPEEKLFFSAGDTHHFYYVFRINDQWHDQACISSYELLQLLYPQGFHYYDAQWKEHGVVYYAPLQVDYSVEREPWSIRVTTNHPVLDDCTHIYYGLEDSYMYVELVDVAGNGPIRIRVPLEP